MSTRGHLRGMAEVQHTTVVHCGTQQAELTAYRRDATADAVSCKTGHERFRFAMWLVPL